MASTLKVPLMLTLGYGCGFRAGEIVRLKVGDILRFYNLVIR